MIRDFKKTFKLLRFSYNFKSYIVMGLTFVLLGIILVVFTDADVSWGQYGGLLAMAGAFFPAQMVYSLAVAETVMVSPLRKKLLTRTTVFINWMMQTCVVLVVALIRGVQMMSNPAMLPYISEEMLRLACFGAVIMLYGILALKYFWIPTVLFCFSYPMMSTFFQGDGGAFGSDNLSFGVAVVIALVILTVGAVLGYWVSLLVYKKPISKMAQSAALRSYM